MIIVGELRCTESKNEENTAVIGGGGGDPKHRKSPMRFSILRRTRDRDEHAADSLIENSSSSSEFTTAVFDHDSHDSDHHHSERISIPLHEFPPSSDHGGDDNDDHDENMNHISTSHSSSNNNNANSKRPSSSLSSAEAMNMLKLLSHQIEDQRESFHAEILKREAELRSLKQLYDKQHRDMLSVINRFQSSFQ